jgi:hypothetical protein
MNSQPKRKQDLAEHLEKDYELLRNYEDQLRYEDDPKRKAKIQSEIAELREQISAREKEMQAHGSVLSTELQETVDQYLAASYTNDQYAELDQAGETDPERSTLLHKVFIDLSVEVRKGPQPPELQHPSTSLTNLRVALQKPDSTRSADDGFSAMQILLRDVWSRIVFIGGPGQGKSTLGQYIAQVHRANLLGFSHQYTPKTLRIPFRIVLKYFAQWLADKPKADNLENYLALSIERATVTEISAEDVQKIFRRRPCLLILDGLDEVVSPEIRSRVLARIQSFLNRMNTLKVDLVAIATSRPTGYKDNFDPEHFWHLDLLPLSQMRVNEFATKWVQAKQRRDEEASRIIRTLNECQHDPSLSKLLTTPLQVTIILLIIKDGGRPPSQREALFNEYWSTIFRREKSKDKGIIQSDEPILFDLHSYLGYVLHRRAEGQDIQSLLPENEFKAAIRSFLRRNDKYSPDEFIDEKLDQLVTEARDRLVMIVEPEPSLFGFELRSIQEFFAAVHLVQTAAETMKRFERLKAIGRPAHWRNVALFSAGRISRNNSGEASNILELVCRPIDREGVDRYLRRGEWLALEVAADGALGTNRDLQYNAIELGLNILKFGLGVEQKRNLSTLLAKLPPEDKRDILYPILTEHLRSLPESRLVAALLIYGQLFGATPLFKEKVDNLLQSHSAPTIDLTTIISTKPDIQWLATHLQSTWPAWKHDLMIWLGISYEYIEELLKSIILSEEQISELIETYWEFIWSNRGMFYHSQQDEGLSVPLNITNLDQPINQLIAALRYAVNSNISRPNYIEVSSKETNSISFHFTVLERMRKLADAPEGKLQDVSDALNNPDLIIWLRAQLWKLYWNLGKPNATNVTRFLNDIWALHQIMPSIEPDTFEWAYDSPWPLLRIAIRKQLKSGPESCVSLLPYLDADQQLHITEQVAEALQEYLISAKEDQIDRFLTALEYQFGLGDILPGLIPIANQLEISVDQLLAAYNIRVPYPRREIPSEERFEQVLDIIEEKLKANSDGWNWIFGLYNFEWPPYHNYINRMEELLKTILSKCNASKEDLISDLCLFLFLKLYAVDQRIEYLASQVFSCIGHSEYLDEETIYEQLSNLSPNQIWVLSKQLSSEDKTVRIGASMLWVYIANATPTDEDIEETVTIHQKLERYSFNPDTLFGLINAEDRRLVAAGIALFAFARFPITDEQSRRLLKTALTWPQQNHNIENSWSQFLRYARVVDEDRLEWASFLQELLNETHKYSDEILDAAKWRYQQVADDGNNTSLGDLETELGLP